MAPVLAQPETSKCGYLVLGLFDKYRAIFYRPGPWTKRMARVVDLPKVIQAHCRFQEASGSGDWGMAHLGTELARPG